MKDQKGIKKWLNHDLTDQELNAFKDDAANSDLKKLDETLKRLSVPEFDKEATWESIKSKQTEDSVSSGKSSKLIPYLLRIAAVLIIAFGVYEVVRSKTSSFSTAVGQQYAFSLPDESQVKLNASSTISYSKKNWTTNRTLELKGEAFFDVEKGSTFSVKTNNGIVRVLGTEFNIKDRENYFEVTCFEGMVEVTHNQEKSKLSAGDSFKLMDGKIVVTEKETGLKPSWVDYKSTFTSEPFKYVLTEFERQYKVEIRTSEVNIDELYTGTFDNKNLDQALKAITLPMQLSYRIENGNVVTLFPKK